MMENGKNTRSEGQESQIRAADFTALTAVSPAITQTAAQTFQAAMWTFIDLDNT